MSRHAVGRPRTSSSHLAALATLAIVVAACSSLAVDGRNLEGTSWRSVSVAGQAPISGSEPTLKIDGGLVSGSMGCNTYASQAPITISNGTLRIGTTLMTLGRCIETGGGDAPVMVIELAFQDALRTADHISFRSERLAISGAGGELVFERQH